MTPRCARYPVCHRRSHGFAMVALITMVAVMSSYLLVNVLSRTSTEVKLDKDQRTRQALMEAKAALIAYAAAQAWDASVTNPQPGALPCPAPDDLGTGAGSCNLAISDRIGRLPWKTISASELRDGSGQVLWYALSDSFQKASGTTVINSGTEGTLAIYDDQYNTTTASQSKVVAVVIAPGQTVSGQNRASNSVSSYLECRNALANGTFSSSPPPAGTGSSCPYTSGSQKADIFNDQIIAITQADLMAVVEPAVLAKIESDIKPYLQTYYTQWSGFPYPSSFTATPGSPGTNTNYLTTPTTVSTRLQNAYSGSNTQTGGQGLLPLTASLSYPWVAGSGAVAITGGLARDVTSVACATNASPAGWKCTFNIRSYDVGTGYTALDTCKNPSTNVRYRYCTVNPVFTVAGDVSNAGLSFSKISPTNATDITVTNTSGSANRTMSSTAVAASLRATGVGTISFSGTHTYSSYNTVTFNRAMAVIIPDRVIASPVTSSTDAIAGWFIKNEWYRHIYYVVSTGYLPGSGNTCSTLIAPHCLAVSGLPASTYPTTNDKRAILILAGYPMNGSTRPSATLSNYLEGNNATPGGTNGYSYVHRVGSPTTINDRVVVLGP